MNACQSCSEGAVDVQSEVFRAVTILQCTTCGRIVDMSAGSGVSGRFKAVAQAVTESQTHTAEPETEIETDVASTHMFVVQSRPEVSELIDEKLTLSEGTDCRFHLSAAEALTELTHSLSKGRSVRLVIFNPEVVEDSGAAFLYAIRAVEMAQGIASIPILVLGDTPEVNMERAIRECKNAKFVSIGRKNEPSIVAERYLKVIGKLANT